MRQNNEKRDNNEGKILAEHSGKSNLKEKSENTLVTSHESRNMERHSEVIIK